MTQQRTEPAPRTAAGRALVEWAHTAFHEQESIWREHALLIEAEAAAPPSELREAVKEFLRRWDDPERYHRLPAVDDLRAALSSTASLAAAPEQPDEWLDAEGVDRGPNDPSRPAPVAAEPATLDVERLARALLTGRPLNVGSPFWAQQEAHRIAAAYTALAASQPTAGEEER